MAPEFSPVRSEVDYAADMNSHEEFSEFYRQTAPALRNYVARATGSVSTADDIVQEAYLRLLRRPLPTTDPQELRKYVFRVASHLITDLWRRHQHETDLSVASEPVANTPDAVRRLDMQRTFRQLRRRDRQLLWLAYVEGASHHEIAASLNLSAPSIRVLLSRAREKLAALLRGEPQSGGGPK